MSNIKTKRNNEIMRLRNEGWELQEIGKKMGVSKQRVYQIITQVLKDRQELRRLKKKKII